MLTVMTQYIRNGAAKLSGNKRTRAGRSLCVGSRGFGQHRWSNVATVLFAIVVLLFYASRLFHYTFVTI